MQSLFFVDGSLFPHFTYTFLGVLFVFFCVFFVNFRLFSSPCLRGFSAFVLVYVGVVAKR